MFLLVLGTFSPGAGVHFSWLNWDAEIRVIDVLKMTKNVLLVFLPESGGAVVGCWFLFFSCWSPPWTQQMAWPLLLIPHYGSFSFVFFLLCCFYVLLFVLMVVPVSWPFVVCFVGFFQYSCFLLVVLLLVIGWHLPKLLSP